MVKHDEAYHLFEIRPLRPQVQKPHPILCRTFRVMGETYGLTDRYPYFFLNISHVTDTGR